MRAKKSFLAVVAASAMALSLAACAPSASEDSDGNQADTTGSAEAPADADDADDSASDDGAADADDADADDADAEDADDAEPAAETEPIDIGIIYSKTGALAAYGEEYIQGLHAGLAYATDGTGVAGNYEINLNIVDDGGDASKAVTAFKDMVGEGIPIIAGSTASGVALQLAPLAEQNQTVFIVGPAATDAVTGINDYTFRSGRQTLQDVATAGTFLTDLENSKVLVFAQDTAFGQGNVAAVDMVLGASGATVDSVLVSESVTEFTPFAQQVLDAEPDLLFVAWAGETSGAMWQALDQQGVFDAVTVTTGLGNIATYGAFGDAASGISFLNHYFPGAGENAVEDAMIELIEADGGEADLFSPDGFNAGLMIAHALEQGATTSDAIIAAFEGWSFDGPKGQMEIRASDHAMIQPMYRVSLSNVDGEWVPELLGTTTGEEVAPAEG